MTATVGENTGGRLYRTYDGLDRVHVRFYVRFLDESYVHHFVTIGGYRPATRWPQGHAGERPRGDERFTVAWIRKGVRRGPWTGMGFALLEAGGEPFEGFSRRTDTRLKANMLSLSLYVTERAMRRNGLADPEGRRVRVRFDRVVVASRCVGPFPPHRRAGR